MTEGDAERGTASMPSASGGGGGGQQKSPPSLLKKSQSFRRNEYSSPSFVLRESLETKLLSRFSKLHRKKICSNDAQNSWSELLSKCLPSQRQALRFFWRQTVVIVLITSVSLALKHVENEFLKKEALESSEDSSVKLLSTMDAFYVVATVMTTIGYGNLSPVSYRGKLLIAIFSVPLIGRFGMLLGSLANMLLDIARVLTHVFIRCFGLRVPLRLSIDQSKLLKALAAQTTREYGAIDLNYKIHVDELQPFLKCLGGGWEKVAVSNLERHLEHSNACTKTTKIQVSELIELLSLIRANHNIAYEKTTFYSAGVLCFIWFFMGFIYYSADWTDVNSFYFSVITLTTVGFGDFFPEGFSDIMFWYFWVLLGCGSFAAMLSTYSTITHAQEVQAHALAKLRRAIGHRASLKEKLMESEMMIRTITEGEKSTKELKTASSIVKAREENANGRDEDDASRSGTPALFNTSDSQLSFQDS